MKHVNFMIYQKFEIIWRLENGESQKDVITLYKTASSNIYNTKN
jgi:hypothetical protein